MIVGVAVLVGAGAAVAAVLGGDDGSGGGVESIAQETVATDPLEREVAPPAEIPPPGTLGLRRAAEAAGCELGRHDEEGAQHTEDPVAYKTNPPTSGDHAPISAQDGVYIESPPVEALVHSLEHGRIIIQFERGASQGTRAGLQALYEEDPRHMVLTVNATGMPYEAAATAWTRSLTCPEMNAAVFDAIRAFRAEYRDQGPEFVP